METKCRGGFRDVIEWGKHGKMSDGTFKTYFCLILESQTVKFNLYYIFELGIHDCILLLLRYETLICTT
mgnify:CR=1 FL=1